MRITVTITVGNCGIEDKDDAEYAAVRSAYRKLRAARKAARKPSAAPDLDVTTESKPSKPSKPSNPSKPSEGPTDE